MATSKSKIAKFIKAIATYSESELTEAVDELNDDERRSFNRMAEKLHRKLKELNTDIIDGKNSTKKFSNQVTMEQKFTTVIAKIQSALQRYESEDFIDEWKIEFQTGVKYDNISSINELKIHHETLIKTTTSLAHIKLLAYVERGRMYNYLKNSQPFGTWYGMCSELNICRRTADRYIDLYSIISAYPRLLICELTFETILTIYKKLRTHLDTSEDLEQRLQQPLRQTKIIADVNLSPESLPGNDQNPFNNSPPEELLTAHADWTAGWQISDEIMELREQADDINESTIAVQTDLLA
jgi:hypothetical protein